ncbi:hypothetical protein AUK40_01585 [Candidatus Wirthbacteria bacterium CG2_30_54_11]|uniref:CMP/dCMP-type deaminase domain-containing protein n=1 Tax=Candidatus Wirthbacteria bacterium CG2_30_54_11 TaxID=1817892 RepID=A0A1J5INW5_9BACT|nr:MAG: hypothetical protein AUK40_01585 [Candidatus Wirthbacteria bacterium CG2_30_54_11]
MAHELTTDEQQLISYAEKAIIRFNTIRQNHGGIDTLYSFILSDSGKIYDGACFEPSIQQATICGERHAIANLILQESYSARIRSILVADPVPSVQNVSTTPCGTCRHIIHQFSTPEATVLCMQYMRQGTTWVFPRIDTYLIKDLYPYPYTPNEHLWD